MKSMGISIEAEFDQDAFLVRVGRRVPVTVGGAMPKEERTHSGIHKGHARPWERHPIAVLTVRTPNHIVNVALEPWQPQ